MAPPNRPTRPLQPASDSSSPAQRSGTRTNLVANGTQPSGQTRSPALSRSSSTRPVRATNGRPSKESRPSQDPETAIAAAEAARAENASLLEELRASLSKAEAASEEYQRQLKSLQARLDDAAVSQTRLEDDLHAQTGQVEVLQTAQLLHLRKNKELETALQVEQDAMLQEKNERLASEHQLQTTIKRLTDTLSQREKVVPSEDPPSAKPPVSSAKDRVIEALRLELAEAQIKMLEVDNVGAGQLQELERRLMEAKIENARLLEDNESFQLLLSEKTLNGDFGKSAPGLSSLAEELDGSAEPESRRHDLEVKNLKDQNRALSLYVEKIIGRLLEHKDFENIFDKNPDLMSGAPRPLAHNGAPPPPPKDPDAAAGGFLQRARSVVAGTSKKPRPLSQTGPTPGYVPGPHEHPSTAPSVPLSRTRSIRNSPHKTELPHAAPIVNQMYRGPPSSGHPVPLGSPGLSPSSSVVRNSFFPPQMGSPHARSVSQPHQRQGSSATSTFSDSSNPGDVLASAAPLPVGSESPPRPTGLSSSTSSNFVGAVMTQNKLRPLRLLQETEDGEAARKKANRASWMPTWVSRASD